MFYNIIFSMMFVWAGFAHAPIATGELKWETDFAQAQARAKRENKKLLVNFTGSDWCGWCIRLDKEVFSQAEFVEYANNNLVCVKIDFPKRKQLPEAERNQNIQLARKYGINAFPTIIIMGTDTTPVFTTGYQYGGAKAYIEHLNPYVKN